MQDRGAWVSGGLLIMGAGASVPKEELAQKANAATEDELVEAMKDVPDDVWAKLVAAREKKGGADSVAKKELLEPKKEEPKEGEPKKEEGAEDVGGDSPPDDWAKGSLAAHNEFRKKHGVPPLGWSDECFKFATKHAAEMQEKNSLSHGNHDGPSGRHGQNVFGGTGKEWTPMDATKSWYDEVTDPGYDFSKPGFASGTGHFTQVVWLETKYVGMAKSANGNFVCANYLPAGNFQGQFEKNVFKEGTAMQKRAPEPKIGTVTATEWNDDVMLALAGCPMDDLDAAVKKAFADGHTVVIEREKTGIKVIVKKKDGSSSTTGGSWG